MRKDLFISGSAVPSLRGNVEHALKVVAGFHDVQSLPPAGMGVASFQDAHLPPMPLHHATVQGGPGVPPPVVGGCWQYQGLDGTELTMPQIFPHFNPHVSRQAGCGCGCPASPAGRVSHGCGCKSRNFGVLREHHVPAGRESDPSIVWQSGFLPGTPMSYVQQIYPSYAAAYAPLPFNSGPQPNTPCVGGPSPHPAPATGTPHGRTTAGRLFVVVPG